MRKPWFAILTVTATLVEAGIVERASGDEPIFVHVAEGYTSGGVDDGIVAARRLFSAPDFEQICSPVQSPARLVPKTSNPLRLQRGQWFTFETLTVLAVDAANHVVPRVPISIEVEEHHPELLSLRSDLIGDGRVMAIRAGRFRLRISTICSGHRAAVTIDAEVVDL